MTAEELFGKHFDGMHYDDITSEKIEQYAVDFAKYHVKKAIDAVLNEVNIDFIDLDTEDLINLRHAYPLDNIK